MTIKSEVLSALRWTALARLTAQVITWAGTIVVIRILDPSDYGLMAMSEVTFGLLMLLSSGGLGSALIQAHTVTELQLRQVFGLLMLIAVLLFAALFVSAPALAAYFQEPRILDVSRVLAFGFLCIPFITMPDALLSRDIDFKRKSIVELCASVISLAIILGMALNGAGVWALVAGRLSFLTFQAIGLQWIRPFMKTPVLSLGAAQHLISFGGIYTATSLLWFIYSQADVIVAGRFLDSETIGYYAVGMHIASLVVSKAMPLLNQIALPAYARVQNDLKAVAHYFLKVLGVVTTLCFPLFFGLAVLAPEFVRIILGAKYEGAILPLTLLSILMPARLISNLIPAVVFALGRPKMELGNVLFGLVVMPSAFVIGVNWGLAGICIAWLAAFPLVLGFQLVRALPLFGLSHADVLVAVKPALYAAVTMTAIVSAAKLLPFTVLNDVVHLVLLVLLGAAVYVGVLLKFHRKHVLDIVNTIKER